MDLLKAVVSGREVVVMTTGRSEVVRAIGEAMDPTPLVIRDLAVRI